MIKGDQDALGKPQKPCQVQRWGVQQVPVMFMKNLHATCLYAILTTLIDLVKVNHGEYSKDQLYLPKIDMAHVDIL